LLRKEVVSDDAGHTLYGHLLWTKARRNETSNKYVSSKRDFTAIRNDSIQSMKNFMTSRLKLSGNLAACGDSLRAFCSFTASADDIRAVWQVFSPDVDLAYLADQYDDIQRTVPKPNDPRHVLRKLLVVSSSDECSTTTELSTTLARILVCKPHSADCERLISAYNRLKSAYRCSLDQETIGNYLYVHTNMPPLSGFDPRPAVLHWLSVTERRHRETPKASKQEWFSTVFFGSNEVEIQRERSNSKVVKKF